MTGPDSHRRRGGYRRIRVRPVMNEREQPPALRRGPDDHDTPGGPWAVMYGPYAAIQAELIRLADLGPDTPRAHDELLSAVHALDRGEREVRIGHCRFVRTDAPPGDAPDSDQVSPCDGPHRG